MPYVPPKPPVPAIVVRPHFRGGEYEVGHVGSYMGLIRGGYQVLPCDGRVYDPSEYRELGAAIGNTFGGTETEPRLPDARGATMQSMAVPPRR